MAVRIGSAKHDENGRLIGGKAGDQTGNEVCIENWYLHAKGWRVIRAKDPAMAERIATAMERACANSNIGYDQSNNQSLFYAVQPLGWDPGKVTTPVETDCSQLVRVCVHYGGFYVPMFDTSDEIKTLINTGVFEEKVGAQYQAASGLLKRGDILVTKTKGHTVVVLSDGAGTKPYQVVADGWWGSDTTKATQRYFGTVADGVISNQYYFNKKYAPNCTSGWQWKILGYKSGSPMIKALQKQIGATQDGIFGTGTATALQNYLKRLGYYGGTPSGKLDYYTVYAWQNFLNAQM